MIGFGELRRRSLEWQVDIGVVERAYATDWLLKGIFDHAFLSGVCMLRGSSALHWAFGLDDDPGQSPELYVLPGTLAVNAETLGQALSAAATASGGLKFAPVASRPGTAKVAYVGPLGRRSAAQPLILLTLIAGRPRLDPVAAPLVHPFGDHCVATVTAVALDEIVAERIAGLAQPRVRDVFDLWLALTRGADALDWKRVRALVPDPAALLTGLRDPGHRAGLERSWDRALRHAPRHPAFARVEQDLGEFLARHV